jgi:hypothetical protein
MDINQPASKAYLTKVEPNAFVVLQQQGKTVTLRNLNGQLIPGNIILFEQDLRGIVTSVTTNEATVTLSTSNTVNYGTKLITPDLPQPSPICRLQGGSLRVKLALPDSYKGASLGWSLFKDSDFIAIGGVSASAEQCTLTGSGIWPAGNYLFCVQAFKKSLPLGSGTVSWVVDTKGLGLLSYGNYDDNTSPLRLQ